MFKLLQKLSKRQKYAGLLLCILLSGCSQYNFVPPQSPAGLFCVSNCAVLREECNSEKSRCMSSCSIVEQKCMAANASYSRPYGHSRPFITPPFGTSTQQDCNASKTHCETQCNRRSFERSCNMEYRECYESCGGTIIITE